MVLLIDLRKRNVAPVNFRLLIQLRVLYFNFEDASFNDLHNIQKKKSLIKKTGINFKK